MAWNNGYERKNFEIIQRKQSDEYRRLGMSELQIKEMYEFDLRTFNSNRRYYSHTQSLETLNSGDCGDQEDLVLMQKFKDSLTVSLDDTGHHASDWWVEEIENPKLARIVKALSPQEIHLLTLYVFEGMKQSDLAEIFGVTQQSISKKTKHLFKKFE